MFTLVRYAVLAVVSLSSSMAIAQAQETSVPENVRAQMQFLVGNWTVAGEDKGQKIQGTYSARWSPGRHCLLLTQTDERGMASGIGGWDPTSGDYVETWYVPDGLYVEIRHDKMGKDEWTGTATLRRPNAKAAESPVTLTKMGRGAFTFRDHSKENQYVVHMTRVKRQSSIAYKELSGLQRFVGEWEGKTQIPAGTSASGKLGNLEGKQIVITSSVRWAPGRCAQIENVKYDIRGVEVILGTTITAWDQETKQIRSHAFTTHKGTWTGTWHTDGEKWIHEFTGTNLDNEKSTGRWEVTFHDDDHYTLRESRTLAGEAQPDMVWDFRRK